jgi:hypothetical protein
LRIHLEHIEQDEAPKSHLQLTPGAALDADMVDISVAVTVLCGDCGDVDRREGWVPTLEAARQLLDEQ